MTLFFANFLLILFAAALRPQAGLGRRKWNVQAVYLCLVIGYLALLSALRAVSVGTDTATYCRLYRKIARISSLDRLWKRSFGYEPGYQLFVFLLTRVSPDPQLLLVVYSFVCFLILGRFFYRHSVSPWFSTLLFFCLMLFDFYLSGIRQTMAISLLLLAYDCLAERKAIRFFLLVALAGTFHNSALLFLLAYPLMLCRSDRLCVLTLLAAAIAVAAFWGPVLRLILHFFPKYRYYLGDSAFGTSGRTAILSKMAVYLAVLIFGLLFRKTVSAGENCPDRSLDFRLVCLLAALSLVALRANVLSRFFRIFEPYVCLYLPEVLDRKGGRDRVLTTAVCVLCFLIYAATIQFLRTPAWQQTYPYAFFWN